MGKAIHASQDVKTNAETTELLQRLERIPTLPVIAMKVNDLLNNPNSSSQEIADLLKKDQVLTAKILKLVNSSYYAIPGGVTDVKRAMAFLGFNTLSQLVLSLSVLSVFKPKDLGDFSFNDFWKHALATAVCAELLAKRLNRAKPEEAFTCGLLHDIGKLVMNEIDHERLKLILTKARTEKISFFEAEKAWDLPGHSYLGEAMATKWSLPQVIRLAIRYHHLDVSKMETILSSAKPLIAIVRLANQLVAKAEIGKSGNYRGAEITPDMTLGLKEMDMNAVIDQLRIEYEKVGALFHGAS